MARRFKELHPTVQAILVVHESGALGAAPIYSSPWRSCAKRASRRGS